MNAISAKSMWLVLKLIWSDICEYTPATNRSAVKFAWSILHVNTILNPIRTTLTLEAIHENDSCFWRNIRKPNRINLLLSNEIDCGHSIMKIILRICDWHTNYFLINISSYRIEIIILSKKKMKFNDNKVWYQLILV